MDPRHWGRRSLGLLALSLSGCSSTISESGPERGTVINGASIQVGDAGNQEKLAYALVAVSTGVLQHLVAKDKPDLFSPDLVAASPNQTVIGVGDVLGVTIFEAGAGGLFIPAEPGTRSGNYVTLPPQPVEVDGTIAIPFAGTIHVAGLSTQAVGKVVQGRLADRALEPQVVVTITERRANGVAVTGEVNQSTHIVLDPGGERLMGAIARAGGLRNPPYESIVTLQRGSMIEHARISEIIRDPRQNIMLQAGDTLFVSRDQRYFLALGALGPGQYLGLVNRRLAFDDSHLSLADGIAKVGGLSDDRANARGVFIYRFENKQTILDFGVAKAAEMPDAIPTVYYLDLAEAAGYFLAGQFSLHNEDIIYVSNAPLYDLTKFLNVILPISYSAANFKTL
jgi:polysaccharide export outer membrane protein